MYEYYSVKLYEISHMLPIARSHQRVYELIDDLIRQSMQVRGRFFQ